MTKAEAREQLKSGGFVSGDVQYEMLELNKIQQKTKVDAIETITVSCTEVLTIICC